MKLNFGFFCLINCKYVQETPSVSRVVHDEKLSEDFKEGTNDYDHEAFFGGNKELVTQLQKLGLKEVKRRLQTLCKTMIDRNDDDHVTKVEIAEWIRYQQVRYVHEDTQRAWHDHNINTHGDGLAWNEYVKQTFGNVDDWDKLDDNGLTFQQNINRDRRKWEAAKTKDIKNIDMEDFSAFLHPEHFPRMHDIFIQEIFEDLDTDQDGKISIEEYISDLTREINENDTREATKKWVENERNMFLSVRDKNGDGTMDLEEVKEWILPDELNHADDEANRLITLINDRKEETTKKHISCQDLVQYHDVFIDSSVTDWGEFLLRHQEF